LDKKQTPPIATKLPLGEHVITINITDQSDNSNTCDTVYYVDDMTYPTLNCPTSVVGYVASDQCVAPLPSLISQTTVWDACDPVVERTQNPVPGLALNIGSLTVTITATDDAGNKYPCDIDFQLVDNTPPVISSCPKPIVSKLKKQVGIQTQTFYGVPRFTDNLGVSDNCGVATIVQQPAPGDVAVIGNQTVTITVTDIYGNFALCTTEFVVEYEEEPASKTTQDVMIPIGVGIFTALAAGLGVAVWCYKRPNAVSISQ
jgi:hypothetical protein